ncbi:hypothetical protein AAC03nite_12990 [Alicyclobacillus acidoterrestris]|nr:hypothetical protein AAC03nite_12990 [Alicyclobacillus acidoterrestris]
MYQAETHGKKTVSQDKPRDRTALRKELEPCRELQTAYEFIKTFHPFHTHLPSTNAPDDSSHAAIPRECLIRQQRQHHW